MTTDLYVASNATHDSPRKLQKPDNASRVVRDTAETYILDSGIGDDTTNPEVLDLAARLDADFVIPCDILHDQEATTESVRDFLGLFEGHRCTATPMIPLQPPHAEHYQDLAGHDYYCLGGMSLERIPASQAVRWIKQFRGVAGSEPHVHALGVGGGNEFVTKMAGTGLIDSVDCATPELAAISGDVIGPDLRRQNTLIHSGGGHNKRKRPLSELNCWQIQDAWNQGGLLPEGQQRLSMTHD